MKIIMTPAKNVKAEVDCFAVESQPVFLTYTQTILSSLQQLSAYQLQKILKCSPRLAQKTYETYQHMNLVMIMIKENQILFQNIQLIVVLQQMRIMIAQETIQIMEIQVNF